MKSPEINAETLKNLLGLFKKLGFFKNNLALLVPIIIVVVALLLFIPTKILQGKLQSTIDKQSVQTARQIEGLIRDVSEARAAEDLEAYINAYARDANQIELLAKQTTMRELLSYDLFPDTNETSPLLFEPFRQRFIVGVEAMLESVNAGGPPSNLEIDRALESSHRSLFGRSGSRSQTTSPYGGTGRYRSLRMMMPMDRKIVDKICEEKAKAAKVYASPVDLEGYTYWSEWKFENRDKAYRDCWYWQLGYWMYEDVMAAIRETNRDTESILTAPVKRIMAVGFAIKKMRASSMGRGARRAARRPGDTQAPAYVRTAREGITTPCTGRFCNEDIDVMHFDVRVIVAADDVMSFMEELCRAKTHRFRGLYGDEPVQTFKHNQITVLESSIAPIDREGFEHSAYRYGDNAVVELDLICEYVFQKAGYEQIKPQLVKDDILATEEKGRAR